MKDINKIVFVVIMLALSLPVLQKKLHIFHPKELDGDFIPAKRPVLTWKSWIRGSYQDSLNKYTEQNIGLRNFFVRLNNQTDFSLFKVPHAEGLVVGKGNVLFEEDYIDAYTGRDFIGSEAIRKKTTRLKYVQERLKKTNTRLILVFEPGKATFSHEAIPERYLKDKKANNNHQCFRRYCDSLNVSYIDLNHYFLELKEQSPYPVYPKYGVHWSYYGMTLAMDSIIGYIEATSGMDLPEVVRDSIIVTDSLGYTDYDAGESLNLFFRLKHEKMAYPVLRFVDGPQKQKPRVLSISDSYYWNILSAGYNSGVFENSAFWYYNNRVFPDWYSKPSYAKDLDIISSCEGFDFIFIMVTERFLHKYDWGFTDRLFEAYEPEYAFDPLYKYANAIRSLPDHFQEMKNESEKLNMPLEELIRKNADYLFYSEEPEEYRQYYGAEGIMKGIQNNEKWFSGIQAKAEKKGITVDSMLKLDAEYIFRTKYPEEYTRINNIKSYIELIDKNEGLRLKIQSLAKRLYIPFDEAAMLEARKQVYKYPELIQREERILHFQKVIKNDPEWYEKIKQKAGKKNIPPELMARMDAEWLTNKEASGQ